MREQVARRDGDLTGKFSMVEYEPAAWNALTGDVLVDVGAETSNAIYIGGRPLMQNAVVIVGENPPTGTQFQAWNPKVNLSWRIIDINRVSGIEVTIRFLKFTDGPDAAGLFRDFLLSTFQAP